MYRNSCAHGIDKAHNFGWKALREMTTRTTLAYMDGQQ
jgi:hypothetical protein